MSIDSIFEKLNNYSGAFDRSEIDEVEFIEIQEKLATYGEAWTVHKQAKKKLWIAGLTLMFTILPLTFGMYLLLGIFDLLPFATSLDKGTEWNFMFAFLLIVFPFAIWADIVSRRHRKHVNSLMTILDSSMEFWLKKPANKEILSKTEHAKTFGLMRIVNSYRVGYRQTEAIIADISKGRIQLGTTPAPVSFKLIILTRPKRVICRLLFKRTSTLFSPHRLFAKPGLLSSFKECSASEINAIAYKGFSDFRIYKTRQSILESSEAKLLADIFAFLAKLNTGPTSAEWNDAEIYMNKDYLVIAANHEPAPVAFLTAETRKKLEPVTEVLNEFDAALALQMLVDRAVPDQQAVQ